MKKTIWLVVGIMITFVVACNDKAGPAGTSNAPAVSADPKRAAIDSAISKTTPEGKTIIEKVQGMKPQINDQASYKTLGEVIDDSTKNKGQYNIVGIGWEATQKKNGRWKVIYHYKSYAKEYLAAEWEYNPQDNTLYPFDLTNAPQFWVPAPEGDKKAKKGK